jgi:hypothetical protein
MHKNIKLPTNRNFGIVFFLVFLIIALWPLFNGETIRYWSLIVSFIFFILGLINSKLLAPLNKIWFKFGILLGNIVAPIVMGIIFFFVITPIGIIMRLFGKDLLNLKKNSKETYWINKDKNINSMRKQF